MSICARCGAELANDDGLCLYHSSEHDTALGRDWAISNRLMCGFIHRGIEPARLPAADREPEAYFWTTEG